MAESPSKTTVKANVVNAESGEVMAVTDVHKPVRWFTWGSGSPCGDILFRSIRLHGLTRDAVYVLCWLLENTAINGKNSVIETDYAKIGKECNPTGKPFDRARICRNIAFLEKKNFLVRGVRGANIYLSPQLSFRGTIPEQNSQAYEWEAFRDGILSDRENRKSAPKPKLVKPGKYGRKTA